MPKRLTIMLEDDLYDVVLARAGGPRKVSDLLNPIIRAGLEASSTVDPEALLSRQVAELATQVARLVSVVADRKP